MKENTKSKLYSRIRTNKKHGIENAIEEHINRRYIYRRSDGHHEIRAHTAGQMHWDQLERRTAVREKMVEMMGQGLMYLRTDDAGGNVVTSSAVGR